MPLKLKYTEKREFFAAGTGTGKSRFLKIVAEREAGIPAGIPASR